MIKQSLVLSFLTTAVVFAQVPLATKFGGQPGTRLSNGKLQLVIHTIYLMK
jgi:hypothetical protein